MNSHFSISALLSLHQQCIEQWKISGVSYSQTGIYQLVEENHSFNYQLWHAEDKARRDDMGAEFVYKAKRAIDGFNQQRNNRMEAMDEWFYHALKPAAAQACPVHSETPGMIIDRLSILSLKYYHMALQVQRSEVSDTHREQCAQKLTVIKQQKEQLGLCLEELLTEVEQKTRTFKVYHQFKMYNDASLNPELYSSE